MRRLVLVRHGESRWNAEGRMQGQACNGLSDTGHAQARATAGAVAATYPHARLVSSDLQRTLETAAPLAAALGTDVVEDPRLRERGFGSWERRLRSDVAVEEPALWERWMAGDDVIGEVGGEFASALADRVVPVLVELLATTPSGGTTVAITHGGPVWHGVHRAMAFTPPMLGGVANTSVTELVLRGDDEPHEERLAGRLVLDRYNEVAHLPVELRTPWRPGMVRPARGASADVRDEVAAS